MKGASLSFSFTCTFFVMHIVNNADTYRSCCVPLGFDDIRLGCYCTDTGYKGQVSYGSFSCAVIQQCGECFSCVCACVCRH